MSLAQASWIVAGLLTSGALAGGPMNLVVNGDLEDPGLAGVNSDYLNTPNGNTDEGTWWISPWQPGGPWGAAQHLPGSMGKMNVNGDNSVNAGVKRVWYQTIAVEPGVQHVFELWAWATHGGCEGYTLEFALDGQPVSGVFCPSGAGLWERRATTFTPAGPSVTVSVRNVSGITFPNDFMLDDFAVFVDPGCNAADLAAPFGLLDLADVVLFVSAFTGGNPAADLAPPAGVFDLADVTAFVGAFTGGCP
jgi:hypothetical protein